MITIRRATQEEIDSDKDTPMTWWPVVFHPGGESVIFICPKGHYMALMKHHIKDDGTVEPSVVCSAKGCDFHEHIKLEGYSEIKGKW
ncbi:MAG: hypothetical protein MUP55_01480 [Candidatus Aenigmarchaeota archaeon]|nr:hypothetical protein [Candidatus Aenigmarchaeota archaeon]